MEQSGRFPVLREFRLGAGRVKLAKAFRANARHCLAVAKKQQTIKTRLQWLEKAELWLELARLTEEPMIWGTRVSRRRVAQRRVILFFWPIRASSANQISIVSMPTAFSRAVASRRAGKLF